jgi:ribosomal RNA assembly protein
VIEEINIPEERKPVLIGKEGIVKNELEAKTETKITIKECIIVEGEDPILVMKAAEVVRAIGRGFAPEKAMLLISEDYELRIVTLQAENENTRKRLMARVIGAKGTTRKILENDTNCLISVYGKTVSLIGKLEEVLKAEEAVRFLLQGRSHGYVYARLRKSEQSGAADI